MRTLHRSRLAVAAVAAAATIAAAGLVAAPASAGHDTLATLRAENRRLRVELEQYKDAYRVLVDGLERIEGEAHGIRDRRVHRRVHRAIERVRRDAESRIDDDHDHDDYDDGGYGGRGLSDAELRAVIDRIDAAAYGDDQLALVRSVAKASYVTADQAVAVMKACDWEDTRIEVAVLLYPRLVDGDQAYRLYDGLTYSSSRTTLRDRLGL